MNPRGVVFIFLETHEKMRAAPATTQELVGILGFAALIAAVLFYFQTPAQQPVVVVPVSEPAPTVILRPTDWRYGGVGPGWASGRWLGEGDFKHFGRMDHPFGQKPHYAGHPTHLPAMPRASPGPPAPPAVTTVPQQPSQPKFEMPVSPPGGQPEPFASYSSRYY